MNVHLLEIPESTSDLADWLEGHLVGLHLGTLVAELLAVHGEPDYRPLDEILGDDLPRVLNEGLQGVSREKLVALLKHPAVLLELQERVVLEGGSHWENRAQANSEVIHQVSEGWKRLQTAISAPHQTGHTATSQASGASGNRLMRRSALLAVAALVLVALGLWQFQGANAPPVGIAGRATWGWDKPDAIPEDASPREYLTALATAGKEWFNKTPQSATELETRLKEFDAGCQRLIDAEHKPLSDEDKAWLVERCRKWKGRMEEHRAELARTGDVEKVRADADETVNALVTALKERAA
jgi:hypothetical protein